MFRVKDISANSDKWVSRMKAVVVDNRDPQRKGRVKVDNPVLGNDWIPVLRTNGTFDPPEIGDVVYVEADAGSPEDGIASGTFTKDNPNLPDEYRKNIPSVRGMFTPEGHRIELDDGDAANENAADPTSGPAVPPTHTTTNRGVRITTSGGQKIHVVEDSAGGTEHILLETSKGNSIKIDFGNDTITVNSNDKVEVLAGGDIVQTGATIQLNGTLSGITTANSHLGVIDLITGVPVIPSPTVFSDV